MDNNEIKMREAFDKAITNDDGNAPPLCEESFNAGFQAAYRPKQVGDEMVERTRVVTLTKGYEAIIDGEDYERVTKWRWSATIRPNGMVYAVRTCKENGKKAINLHRFLMNCPKGMEVDHINHNPLDNRKSNLRICTMAENRKNIPLSIRNTTGYKGIYWDTQCNCWRAKININGKSHCIGRYETPTKAAQAYDIEAIKQYGEFAATNKSLGLFAAMQPQPSVKESL